LQAGALDARGLAGLVERVATHADDVGNFTHPVSAEIEEEHSVVVAEAAGRELALGGAVGNANGLEKLVIFAAGVLGLHGGGERGRIRDDGGALRGDERVVCDLDAEGREAVGEMV
jgi:hypothetical protein